MRCGSVFHHPSWRGLGNTAFAPDSWTGSLNCLLGSLIRDSASQTVLVRPGMCVTSCGLQVALPRSKANSLAVRFKAVAMGLEIIACQHCRS